MVKYKDIMQYESDIWAAADLLIAAGIKQSKFPEYMMPYFALVMLESRMRKEAKNLQEEEGLSREDDLQEFIDAFKDLDCGYNEYIVEQNKTLADICKNDKTFEQDYKTYLNGFDNEIKTLLGVERGSDESKFLNITGINAELKKKRILYHTVSKWSEIDFTDFDNSEITTLEEHIKRKWADISAETAGEQYTPNDIISLIAEIVGAKVENKGNRYLSIYDPTCGGGNLLFGVGDRLQKDFGHKHVQMYGRDFNDSLYALAAIESRFRNNANLEYGNTLTARPFGELEFDVVVANPPYGISWKGYEDEVRKDETGQFGYYPSVSDGQLLFMQHIVSRLNTGGFAVEVHNGSTLFSGDAGGGESNIRKTLFDNDWVEAIIQMPSDEFFNTGIFTYLWVMNKNKPVKRKDKVILINGSNGWKQLKKSRGSKRREMLPEHRESIVNALLNFENNDIAKVFDKWRFYYNKQPLTLTNIDDNGKSVLDSIAKEKAYSLKLSKIYLNDMALDASKENLVLLKNENTKEGTIRLVEKNGTEYSFDKDKNTIVRAKGNETEELGCGKFTFKLSKNKKNNSLSFSAFIETDYLSDYEIISYLPNFEENRAHIKAFMDKYISKPYYLKDEPTIGVELNFNKEFYVPEKIEKVDDILAELKGLEKELNELEGERNLIDIVTTRGQNPNVELKDSGINWIGKIPMHWDVKRAKDIFIESKAVSSLGIEDLLSVSEYYGIAKRVDKMKDDDEYESRSDSLIGYKICKKGDLVINIMLAWKRGLGVSDYDGIVSPAYAVYKPIAIYSKFFHYLMRTDIYIAEFKRNSKGIIDSRLRLYTERFYNILFPVPPLSEQQEIADYLDQQSEKIDIIVSNINAQIQKLQTLRKSLISEVVTGERSVV